MQIQQEQKWGRTGRIWEKGNHNQNVLYEINLFLIREKKYYSVDDTDDTVRLSKLECSVV